MKAAKTKVRSKKLIKRRPKGEIVATVLFKERIFIFTKHGRIFILSTGDNANDIRLAYVNHNNDLVGRLA